MDYQASHTFTASPTSLDESGVFWLQDNQEVKLAVATPLNEVSDSGIVKDIPIESPRSLPRMRKIRRKSADWELEMTNFSILSTVPFTQSQRECKEGMQFTIWCNLVYPR